MSQDMQVSTFTRRVIYVCRKCKAARTVEFHMEATITWHLGHMTRTTRCLDGTESAIASKYSTCACGGATKANTVRGTFSAHECDGKCINAKNSACECSCGGANHGSNYRVGA